MVGVSKNAFSWQHSKIALTSVENQCWKSCHTLIGSTERSTRIRSSGIQPQKVISWGSTSPLLDKIKVKPRSNATTGNLLIHMNIMCEKISKLISQLFYITSGTTASNFSRPIMTSQSWTKLLIWRNLINCSGAICRHGGAIWSSWILTTELKTQLTTKLPPFNLDKNMILSLRTGVCIMELLEWS